MRNLTAGILAFVLVTIIIVAGYYQVSYGNMADMGAFIVTAMAALGTCGVTILNVFPYVPRDRLDACLCRRKKKLYMMIRNKGNHTVYLGSDKYHTAEYMDPYALWWDNETNCTEKNSKQLYALPGDNMAVPPRSTISYVVPQRTFGKKDLNKIKIEVMTSSGFRINATKKL